MIPDSRYAELWSQVESSYQAAFAPGTLSNHRRQFKCYLKFMSLYKFNYLIPTVNSILMFTQYLANSHHHVTTVKNYLSGAKTFVRNLGGDLTAFESFHVSNLLKGVARLSSHVPSSPPSLTVTEVRRCADALAALGPLGIVARGAFLFGVATFLRQSNYVSGAVTTRLHLLRRRDLDFAPPGMLVTVASSKTIRDPRDAVVIPVAAAPGSRYCPVAACKAALAVVTAPASSPVFLCPPNGAPLSASLLLRLVRAALRAHACASWASVSLHSLRHTGARLAAGAGAPLPEIMDHGTWRSRAVRTYVPKVAQSSVPSRLTALLANGPKELNSETP